MLRTLNDLFRTLFDAPAPVDAPSSVHSLQLATAVLLVEVMRSDAQVGAEERQAVLAALRDKFALADDELARLFELAETEAQNATDFYRFTSKINKGFSAEQKLRVVEFLWRVALADSHLSHHENHLMRRLGDLLHIPHADYVAAKQRAREQMTVRETSAERTPGDQPR
ncbi:TerB family tellurite resistance protein [Aromatoleum diolicum]|uniref:TerB family tellurite resistance protein n=1 Tax=Aromatoleum diolicum TaxID=75796 RepID=A0ABX1QBC1_9RHOO|nr:TerB family tellurite resistance protein [Aromatoleum diolicum]NMG74410.1 TerB family tellurite resistance protein [Aromatoleum diolicum]